MTERERLYELIVDYENHLTQTYPQMTDRFRIEMTVEHLVSNGVIVLPCKVGQKLYDISEFIDGVPFPEKYEIEADYITFYNKFPDSGEIGMTINDWEYNLSDFGKIVFLTEEEAEAALAERSKG